MENKSFVFSREGERTFIPVEEFPKIKTLQSGDLVQFGKGQISTIVRICNADNIGVNVCKEMMENSGDSSGETIKIGIDDISMVATPQK